MEMTRCGWPDCARDAVRTVWLGDDAGGRDLPICAECFAKHFEE